MCCIASPTFSKTLPTLPIHHYLLPFPSVLQVMLVSCHVKLIKAGVAQWVARLTRNVEVVGSSPINGTQSKKLYPYCLVLVGSRNGFERDFTIELNIVKYRQNQIIQIEKLNLFKLYIYTSIYNVSICVFAGTEISCQRR